MSEERVISWKTREYRYIKKQAEWYWSLGIITISLSIASAILSNLSFAGVVLLSGFLLAVYGVRIPRVVTFVLNKKGLQAGLKLYPFVSLKSFWVEDLNTYPKLILQSKKTFMPYIVIPLGDTDTSAVREFLLRKLPEEEHCESVFDKLAERLGF